MTFSGDHLEEKTHWSKMRSRITLTLIIIGLIALLLLANSRGYALMSIAFMITVMLHEFGHFIAAKKTGMKATEFFVGFGPRIWSFKKGETEYGLKAIPLGGYVKIIGMTSEEELDHSEEEEARTYRKAKTWKKLIVIMAGVTVNIILAFILIFTSLVFRGVPQPVDNAKAEIEITTPNSPAKEIGLKPGDVITKIDNVSVETFEEMRQKIATYIVDDKAKITFLRDGKSITKELRFNALPDEKGEATKTAYLGVQAVTPYKKVNPVTAVGQSLTSMKNIIDTSIGSITRTFSTSGLKKYSNTVIDGDYARQDRPSSVVGIVDQGGDLVNQDIWYLVYIIALVNIFLALFNTLPLLPLDGGHAAIAIYEGIGSKIKKRPVVANFKKLVPIAVVVVGAFAIIALSSIWLDILQIAS